MWAANKKLLSGPKQKHSANYGGTMSIGLHKYQDRLQAACALLISKQSQRRYTQHVADKPPP